VELTLLTPLLVALLLFIVVVGRFAEARFEVDDAARDAARAASLGRSPDEARSMAEQAAAATLDAGGVACRAMTVDVDLSDFRPGGNVAADVACVVDLADVGLIRLPGAKTLAASSVAVVDIFREVR
jgi:Flp pilus assembly protein TadG